MPELSPPFRDLLQLCPTCGGPMPCALHDAQLREAMLRPPERSPWEMLARKDVGRTVGAVAAIAPLPDGKFIVVHNGQKDIQELDPNEPQGLGARVLITNDQWISAALVLTDGTVLIGSEWGRIARYDRRSSGAVREDLGESHSEEIPVTSLRELPDHTVLIGGEDGRVIRLDLTKPERERFDVLIGSRAYDDGATNNCVEALDMLPDGTLLLAIGDHLIRFDRSKPKGQREEVLEDFIGEVNELCPLSDGTYLVGGATGRIWHVDLSRPRGSRAEEIADFGEGVSTLTLLAPTSFLAAGLDGMIARYDVPEAMLRAQQDRKLEAPKIPPMPE